MTDLRAGMRVGKFFLPFAVDYSVDVDMLTPADGFSLTYPCTADYWQALRPDSEVEVLIGDTRVLSGYIDRRRRRIAKGEQRIVVTGRDKCGRLVDESMEPGSIRGNDVRSFVAKCASPWFGSVVLSNATNRAATKGVHTLHHRSGKYRAGQKTGAAVKLSDKREPMSATQEQKLALRSQVAAANAAALAVSTAALPAAGVQRYFQAQAEEASSKLRALSGGRSGVRVEPGNSRWQCIVNFLEDTGLLVWGAADGQSLIVGLPNYDQPTSFRFVIPQPQSDREDEANVLEGEIEDSLENRYAKIVAYGHGRGKRKQTSATLKFHGIARNGPREDGTGNDFQRSKLLILADGDQRSQRDIEERARKEMGERDAHGRQVTLTVRGHGQSLDGGRTFTLYTPDTMSEIVDEVTGETGLYLITAVGFRGSKSSRRTELRFVPKGSLLKI